MTADEAEPGLMELPGRDNALQPPISGNRNDMFMRRDPPASICRTCAAKSSGVSGTRRNVAGPTRHESPEK